MIVFCYFLIRLFVSHLILQETEKEALQASAERDKAIQDLQAALANHVKELEER